jgi:hypothetical protein
MKRNTQAKLHCEICDQETIATASRCLAASYAPPVSPAVAGVSSPRRLHISTSTPLLILACTARHRSAPGTGEDAFRIS